MRCPVQLERRVEPASVMSVHNDVEVIGDVNPREDSGLEIWIRAHDLHEEFSHPTSDARNVVALEDPKSPFRERD